MKPNRLSITPRAPQRHGMSYLEVQVAMVLLAIATSGLYSISVLQTRQSARLSEAVFETFSDQNVAINPPSSQWARKIGVLASFEESVDPEINIDPEFFFSRITDDRGTSPPTIHRAPSDFYSWTSWPGLFSFGSTGTAHFHFQPNPVGEGSYFEQEVTGIPSGNYEILVTYPYGYSSIGQVVEYQIYDGASLLSTVNVNQLLAPADTRMSSHTWKRIDVLPITSGTLRVRILDGPGGDRFVLADAIAVRTRRFELTSIDRTPSGGATAVLEVP